MKKLCVLIAIVCAAVVLCASCGKPEKRITKVELYAEESLVTIDDACHLLSTYVGETMEEAVEALVKKAPTLYDSEKFRKIVENYRCFYIPDNGDEIISYNLATGMDYVLVRVDFKHGDSELWVTKCSGDENAKEMKVGSKSVYYSVNEVDGEDIITSIFYRPEGGDILQICKITDYKSDKSIQFTKEEISALGEDFFNFKSLNLIDYFGEDYISGQTE